MEQQLLRQEKVTKRPLYVYDLPQDILSTLNRKENTGNSVTSAANTLPDFGTNFELDDGRSESTVGVKACTLCRATFDTVEEQRHHTRSDLHGYNLKQKIRGDKPMNEREFEKLAEDFDESLSGSDSRDSEDSEDGSARKETTLSALLKKKAKISSSAAEGEEDLEPKKRRQVSGKAPILWFTTSALPTNVYLGIYRSIFSNIELQNEFRILDAIQAKQLRPQPQAEISANFHNKLPIPMTNKDPHIFLCMIGGGHFAAMVVSLIPKKNFSTPSGPLTKEAIVLAHKSFHRYTTRRKQGGAQSTNDSSKGAAHSAGAGLRRYNEQALTEEVRILLHEWKDMIETSELLFIRATGTTNRRTLFGPYEGQVLRQKDARIRGFPFNTRRATQDELMRSFVELTRVKVLEIDEAAIAAAQIAASQATLQAAATKSSKKSQAPQIKKPSEQEETDRLHTSQIQALIRRSRLSALLKYLETNSLSPEFVFQPQDSPQNHHASTPLLLAASLNSVPLITGLLVRGHADPGVRNADGKTAYELAGERVARDAFRVARFELGDSAWHWESTHIPAAISPAEAEQRDLRDRQEEARREAERRQAETARLEAEGPKVAEQPAPGYAVGKRRMLALGLTKKTAQEKRADEARGLTPEMRMRLDRERRARAAEERMNKMVGGGT